MHDNPRLNEDYVRYIHSCLGNPASTTFLQAVQRGCITSPNQFPRLTTTLVRRNMPDSEATAKGHFNKTPTGQPHAASQSVDAQRRLHRNLGRHEPTNTAPFDPTSVPRSTTLHIDYTGRLPERCETGTLYFLVACHGAYIHLEPLTSMQGLETATAITAAVEFYRQHGVQLDTIIRMDNQSSPEARAAANKLLLKWEFVSPYQKEPNRADCAIRTAKNHIIATRSGFHRDCPHTYLDRCLTQTKLTLNLIHPFEYDPRISAYEGLIGHPYDFNRHPIAPAGSKVLTWDSPDKRGT
jgi:hypothetical protein